VNVNLRDYLAVWVSVYPLNFLMSERIFMKFRMHIVAPEPTSMFYFINPTHLTPCLSVFRGNISINTFPRHRRIVGGVVFYTVRVVSKESRRLILPRTSYSLVSIETMECRLFLSLVDQMFITSHKKIIT
jgi:hypothetical protein